MKHNSGWNCQLTIAYMFLTNPYHPSLTALSCWSSLHLLSNSHFLFFFFCIFFFLFFFHNHRWEASILWQPAPESSLPTQSQNQAFKTLVHSCLGGREDGRGDIPKIYTVLRSANSPSITYRSNVEIFGPLFLQKSNYIYRNEQSFYHNFFWLVIILP